MLFILTSSTLNGQKWFGHIITLPSPGCLLLATGASKIHSLAHPSGPSNVPQDLSVKITTEKLIFMYFHALIYLLLWEEVAEEIFYRSQFPNYSTPFVLFESLNSSIFKDLRTGHCSCLTIIRFNLHLSPESQFLKLFSFLQVLN